MMNLKFAHAEINEYAEGPLLFINNGEAFAVEDAVGRELVHAKAWLGGGFVNVFVRADDTAATEDPTPETGTTDEVTLATAEDLAKLPRKELEAIADSFGISGLGYTNKRELAEAIITARGE